GICLHLYGVGFNCDALLSVAKLKLEIDTAPISDLQPNILLFGELEITALRLHVVAANGKIGGHVLTDVIRGQMTDVTSIDIGDCDRDVRYGRTRRVGYGA